jgi:hypothetical protein
VKSLDESNSNIMRAFVCSCDGEFRVGVDPTPAIHAFVLSLVRASPPLRFLQVWRKIGRASCSERQWARGSTCLAYFTLGEDWHASHHRFPSGARHGFLPHYFEWTWQTIRFVRWLGLATEAKLPNKELIETEMGDYYE